jgi:methyl-accepting chemotaxis protein
MDSMNSIIENYETEFNRKAVIDSFIQNIHIIPMSGIKTLSSLKKPVDGFYDNIIDAEEGQRIKDNKSAFNYLGEHPTIDKIFGTKPEDYAFYLHREFQMGKAGLIIDIDRATIEMILSELNLGESSKIALITKDGKEIFVGRNKDGAIEEASKEEFQFYSQDFVQDSIVSDEMSDSQYIKYNSEEYLYMYKKIGETGLILTGMIPKTIIMEQARDIKTNTIIFTILCGVIAVLIGTFMSQSIGKAIHNITKNLKLISQGDLTVHVKGKRNDEFAIIAEDLMEMLQNIRSLIQKVANVGDRVSDSALKVIDTSNTIAAASNEISTAIDDIGKGIGVQAEDSQDCLTQMDGLSQKISAVNENIVNIETVANENRDMILKGITTMEELTSQSKATNQITKYVVDNVSALEQKSKAIGIAIQTINEIADQTNLLSLNASIEAARAGESGKGFAVVAAEIRNLASKSMESAQQIEKVVKEIKQQTADTVITAKKAENIVGMQDSIVNATIEIFNNMISGVERLTSNLNTIGENMKNMEGARISTLSAVESISAVSEETLASSDTVYDIVSAQSNAIVSLEQAATLLNENSKELGIAINKFKL